MLTFRRVFLSCVSALVLLYAATALDARQAPPDPTAVAAKVDAYMQAQLEHNGFSGAVLLARDGKPIVSKGYGAANIEWQIPNTPDTKFRIGSITKQFTSMVIMQLREQGKLKLEDSVCAFVTPCPETWKPVTIHHLLTHTSGIPTYTSLAEWRKVNMVPKTIDEMIGFFRDLPLQWAPGEKFAYNNSGYFLLGVVIEKASSKKYEEAVRDMIFTPLGMNDSGYDWTSTIIPRRASGYQGRGAALANAAPLDMQQPYAAGSLYSTTEDLLKWDQALYSDKLLPAAARQLMWTPALNDYAYGWSVRDASPETLGYKRIAHSGGINGFSSMIIRVPELNLTSIVLTNNTATPAGPVATDLLAIYLGKDYKMPRAPKKLSAAILDQYVGEYELRPGFTLTISRNGEWLVGQATGQGPLELFPESETKFFAKGPPIGVTFVKDATGTVTQLILHQNGDRPAKKIK